MTISQRISALPEAPDPAIHPRTQFAQIAAASVLAQRALPGQINTFADQANALAVEVTTMSVNATTAAQNAAASAADAASIAGADAWVSGRTYAKNASAISQINFKTYRRKVAGAGTIDPVNDPTNWEPATLNGTFIPQAVAASSVNLGTANYFTRTQTGNQTYTFDNCPSDGYSFTLELTVTAGIASLPASVKTPDDVPYTLTVGKVHELMFVTSNRGARWRLAAATNYTI